VQKLQSFIPELKLKISGNLDLFVDKIQDFNGIQLLELEYKEFKFIFKTIVLLFVLHDSYRPRTGVVDEFDVLAAVGQVDSSVVASWNRAAVRLFAGVHSNVIPQGFWAFELPVAQMAFVLEDRICFVNQHVRS
jgi:hypothetical protein